MRSLSPSTSTSFSSSAATLVQCWHFKREDGIILGLTDHDLPITIEDVTYHPITLPLNPSFGKQIGFSSDQGECSLLIDGILMTQNDIVKGLWNKAAVTVYFVDWQNPNLEVVIFKGKIAALTQNDKILQCTLHGMIEDYRHRPIGRTLTRLCDALLGDSRCGLNIDTDSYRLISTVQTTLSGNRFTVASGIYDEGWFSDGKAIFDSGLNTGLVLKIQDDTLESTTRIITLWETPPFKINAGDAVTLWAGCNKIYKTCLEKFNNSLNFQGFPDLPSDDALIRRPLIYS